MHRKVRLLSGGLKVLGRRRRTVEKLGGVTGFRVGASAQFRDGTAGPRFAKELRLLSASRNEVKVENPIGAGAAWTFGSGSETDSQAVTLCGARWPRLPKRVRGRVEKSALRLRGGEPQRGRHQEGQGVVGGGASA